MVGRLQGKTAIVFGAGSRGAGWGNGKAAAVLFAREGAKIFAVDINPLNGQWTINITGRKKLNSRNNMMSCENIARQAPKVVSVLKVWHGRNVFR